MVKKSLKLLSVMFLCLILTAAAFGCLGSKEYTIEGKIMTEDGSQPFENSRIYIELVNITDSENHVIMERLILENGSQVNYRYTLTHDNVLDPKGIYTITALVDMDSSGNLTTGDYASKPIFRLEPNMVEQPFDIYVYLNE
ncbi:hypothetical protein MmiHf6_05960 [Methanimicrococcus hongohii]|uniref:Uncharacterized protein n=1 Tax=Methanimicrococcus hongohii TaxID=3028295 RepID=A0AA96UZ13_9EURY|nr:hypothetical protein [Methanimicrococcus sp. Hf6]WNY23291.1 hypothetical protein MmiHf6_05960 [Methanimicrococcus sp. Hf6]